MGEREPVWDRIHLRDLLLRCIVGVNEEERGKRQDVVINLTLHADLRQACRSDRIEDTINYRTIKQAVIKEIEGRSFHLIERVGERVAEICLGSPGVRRVDVVVDKPGALRFARSVAVELTRFQDP